MGDSKLHNKDLNGKEEEVGTIYDWNWKNYGFKWENEIFKTERKNAEWKEVD